MESPKIFRMLVSKKPTIPRYRSEQCRSSREKTIETLCGPPGSSAQQHHFDVLKNDCVGSDGYSDGTNAWKLLQEQFCSVERPTVVSLVGQLAKLRLGSEEDLDDYFVRRQELMTWLSGAGEAITETLFNALVINGLPDSYEHFVVQESFQPAKTFPELRTRLSNYNNSRNARCWERLGMVI